MPDPAPIAHSAAQTEPLLEVAGLRVVYPGQPQPAIDEVAFTLHPGQTLALVGASGSGKSVTARAILQLDPEAKCAGSVRFAGRELIGASQPVLRRVRGEGVGMVFQEPLSALNPLHPVGRQIGETLALHRGLGGKALQAAVTALLHRVHLHGVAERCATAYPHQLSGGQRQRALIAMALACSPRVLIADEPTTALDAHLRLQILGLLKEIASSDGMGLLLISHDLGLVRGFADQVAVMHEGRVVEQGATAEVFAAPAHAATRALLAVREARLAPPLAEAAPAALTARGVSCCYREPGGVWRKARTLPALAGIDFSLARGETLGVVGESGSGKTTLAMAALRLLREAQGEVTLGSAQTGEVRLDRLHGARLRAARQRIQLVLQDPFASLSPRMTVGEIVEEGLLIHRPELSAQARRDAAVEALQEVGLPPETLARYPHAFSGGQRQRIAIARVLVLAPEVLILDEPTSALDAHIGLQVLKLLAQLQSRHGLSYVLITHDLAVVRALAHRVMVLQNGAVVECGPLEAVFGAPQQPYTRQLLAASQYLLQPA
ncbi:dipeptide ABC transporter ATP-binding protein [Chitiniphilus purpureus]|uniref:Dipeptide ABC transporter ATP-binding protein n=1 Tax=Chitiniphilus purpureus TaxID=2981137 RepID=A0ABY6DKI9_9NEIS|nr:dipeptide ABC transporter ATP-binding protein [Chitiniphilus sp. CD1]UXY14552.1 dipeptide ABC transporter ATP-binding protein [Chitiniphilus sp. CD1]